jgi:cobalt-zinc-cadmium efflux system outer membrane protein
MCQKKAFSFILSLALLTGCTSFHSRPLKPTQTALALENRSLDNVELKEFLQKNLHCELSSWPPQSWDFRMLALVAIYYSPALDVMRAKWGVADAAVITAGGRPNPRVSTFGEHHSSAPGGISPWTWGISLDIPIETAGKRGYRIGMAKHLSVAAQLNIAETTWQVWSDLRRSLLDLYAATERARYLLDQLSAQEEIVKLFEERLAVGESSQFEVIQSRLVLDKARLMFGANQKKKAEARSALAKTLGLQAKALGDIDISFDLFKRAPGAFDLKDIRRKALLGRWDILAALQEYEASQSALQLEIAKQYPDIHLGPGYEWDQSDNRWSLGFSFVLPFFNQNQGPIAEAKARRKELVSKFMALQASVIGQIDSAEAAYTESLKNLQTADSLVFTQASNMQTIWARFDSGDAGRLDLEQAKMELASAQLSRFDAFISVQTDMGELEDAVQRPLNEQQSFPELMNSYKPPDEKLADGR